MALLGANIRYAKSDLHTLSISKNQIDISLEYRLLNDTVDIFNLKEKELGGIKGFASIGDLNGYGISLRYGIKSNLMIDYKHDTDSIEYLSDTMKNSRDELYLRYHLFENDFAYFNSGVSFDIGYMRNSLDDFYLKDIKAINEMIKRVLPGKDAKLLYSDGVTPFSGEPFARTKGYYSYFNHTMTKLAKDPYISITNTKDDSFFLRVLSGFNTDKKVFDMYTGYRYTKIKSTISSTDEIVRLAKTKGYDLKKILDRDENMLFLGFNYSQNIKRFIYEFNYEYDRFFRGSGLGYLNSNHIINASISYVLDKNTLLSLGGKIMYRQFNGVIPYLYNKYTQTTFDHKYGYMTFGIEYKFK